jgi:2,5-dihydroxypyridine 5,6-dioxygenase
MEKPYLDVEKELFDKLTEEEKEGRISVLGQEGAIQQYGYEMALKSAERPEKELSPEEEENLEQMTQAVKNVLSLFELKRSADNTQGENLIIVTDEGVDELVRLALWQGAKEIAQDDARIIVTPRPEHSAQILGASVGEDLKHADAILLATSLSRTHSQEVGDLLSPHSNELIAKLQELRKKERDSMFPSNSRVISITSTTQEILTEGASQEDFVTMRARIEKMKEIMKDVERVHITSELGTDLEVDIKEYTLLGEDGYINRPGMGSNFPVGEYGGAVDLEKTNGVLVVDGAITNIGRVVGPIRIEIKQGKVVSIKGDDLAEKLQTMLEKANEDYRKQNAEGKADAFKIAEFSFGMNSKAFRYNASGEKIAPPTSLEAEKGLGTIHIAFGKNTVLGVKKDDPDYNNIAIHVDNVVMKPTVKGIRKDGSEIEIINNGEFKL